MAKRVIIIGGGIVGLATAYRLRERAPEAEITVLEKEDQVGRHQSSHNSGVLHCGLYYKPGSLRARLAVSIFPAERFRSLVVTLHQRTA